MERDAEIKELATQVESLQGALAGYKEALQEHYKTGFEKGVHAYMRSTWKRVLDFQWDFLGADAMKMVEGFKEEAVAEAAKLQVAVLRKDSTKKIKSTKGVITDLRLSSPNVVKGTPANMVEVTPADPVEAAPAKAIEVTPSDEAMEAELVEKTLSLDITP